MPCQIAFDGLLPFALAAAGTPLNSAYIMRVASLFARCTWQPPLVNRIDAALDWIPQDGREFGFVSVYLQAVKGVLAGQSVIDSYRDLLNKKRDKLVTLLEQARDEPFSLRDATILIKSSGASGMTLRELEQLQASEMKKTVGELQEQRESVIETYARQALVPLIVSSGELARRLESESWSSRPA
jgi:hypothetical protein